jgi:hydroxymethylpyrimidine/phosphomethylpyrimidine kinase
MAICAAAAVTTTANATDAHRMAAADDERAVDTVMSDPAYSGDPMAVDSRRPVTALTIAGSDPTGGAGLQADIRTFLAHDVFPVSAVTAITVQDENGVRAIMALSPELVGAQIDAAVRNRAIDAVKIGMLANARVLEVVARKMAEHRLHFVVLDPVLSATAGGDLLESDAVPLLMSAMMPLVHVVTPNVHEMRVLTGIEARSVADLRAAAAQLVARGARAAVVKGGHLPGDPVDVVYDGATFTELPGQRVVVSRTHGTGCAFSSALAARLARGDDLVTAAQAAKNFVTDVLRRQAE